MDYGEGVTFSMKPCVIPSPADVNKGVVTVVTEDQDRDYDDIPGTYVFDARRAKEGYQLNKFLMSLNEEPNREAFRSDPSAYLDRFKLTPEQRTAVEERQWLHLLEVGGNVYYTFKLAIFDGLSMQGMGGDMSSITEAEFAEMMRNGGRPIEGNRFKSEWENKNNG